MRIKAHWIFVVFCLLLAGDAYGQVGVIRGEVKDPQGNPLKDVQIEIQGTDVKRNYTVKTDKSGKFYHGGVTLQGVYRVVAKKEGYVPDYMQGIRPAFGGGDDTRGVANFTLKPGEAKPLDFEMTDEQKAAIQKQVEEAKKLEAMAEEVRQTFNQGLDLSNQGNYEQAIEAFKKALEKAPNQPYIWANLGSAQAKLASRNPDRTARGPLYGEAVASFEKALAVKADDPALYQNLGNIYAEMGNIEKAKETFEKAATLSAATNPKDAAINYYNMGVTFINSGKNKEAIEALTKAIEADPNHSQAHYQLGISLLGANRIKDAIAHLQKYVELAPGTPDAETAKALIQELSKSQ